MSRTWGSRRGANRLERLAGDRCGQLRRAVRGKAARFHDPAQIEAWAQGGEIDLANAIFEYLEVFYNRRRRHCCLECATPHDYDLAGTPRALTTTGS